MVDGMNEEDSEALDDLAAADLSPGAVVRAARALVRSAHAAGAGAVASGRWLATTVAEVAPRIQVRSYDMLVAQHGGLTGPALANELVRRAARTSAAVGAAVGAVMGAEELAPPTWMTLPVELVIETLAVLAIEMKLIAELHEAFGLPLAGTPAQRGTAVARSWAERRGVTAASLVAGGGLAEIVGRHSRDQLTRVIRQRVLRRMGKNMTTLAPFLIGAAVGAGINRRATRQLGDAIMRDLATRTRAY
jgi:hypothetical protein